MVTVIQGRTITIFMATGSDIRGRDAEKELQVAVDAFFTRPGSLISPTNCQMTRERNLIGHSWQLTLTILHPDLEGFGVELA